MHYLYEFMHDLTGKDSGTQSAMCQSEFLAAADRLVEHSETKAHDYKDETTMHMPVDVAVESGETYWWCACGSSKKQPFCDGSHKGTVFSPLRYQPTETALQRFCVCKKTQNAPLCDGAHHECAPSAQVGAL